MHLDIRSPDICAESRRLVSLGATIVTKSPIEEDGITWLVMHDPVVRQACGATGGLPDDQRRPRQVPPGHPAGLRAWKPWNSSGSCVSHDGAESLSIAMAGKRCHSSIIGRDPICLPDPEGRPAGRDASAA
jgi:hypothetical protein